MGNISCRLWSPKPLVAGLCVAKQTEYRIAGDAASFIGNKWKKVKACETGHKGCVIENLFESVIQLDHIVKTVTLFTKRNSRFRE